MNKWTDNSASGRYLYVESEFAEGSFEERMISSIASGSLLVPAAAFRKGRNCLEYNITGLTGLMSILKQRAVSASDMTNILTQTFAAVENAGNYLLSEDNLLMDIDCIYFDSVRNSLCFCAVPEQQGGFARGLRQLLSELLGHIDINDSRALRIGFKLMRSMSAEEFRLHDALKSLEDEHVFGEQEMYRENTGTSKTVMKMQDLHMSEDIAVSPDSASDRRDIVLQTAPLPETNTAWNENIRAGISHADSKAQENPDSFYKRGAAAYGDSINKNNHERDHIGSQSERMRYFGEDNDVDAHVPMTGQRDDNEHGEQYTDEAEPEMAGQEKGHGIRSAFTGFIISQAVLAAAAAAIYLVKGSAAMQRLIPVYIVIAVCLTLYHAVGFFISARAQ